MGKRLWSSAQVTRSHRRPSDNLLPTVSILAFLVIAWVVTGDLLSRIEINQRLQNLTDTILAFTGPALMVCRALPFRYRLLTSGIDGNPQHWLALFVGPLVELCHYFAHRNGNIGNRFIFFEPTISSLRSSDDCRDRRRRRCPHPHNLWNPARQAA